MYLYCKQNCFRYLLSACQFCVYRYHYRLLPSIPTHDICHTPAKGLFLYTEIHPHLLPEDLRTTHLNSHYPFEIIVLPLKPHVVPRKSYRLNLLGCILYDCKQNVCRTLWLFEWRTRHSKVRRQEAALIATDAFLSLSQMKGWPPCGAMSTKLLSTRRLPVNDSRYLTKFHVPLNKSYFCLFCEWCLVFYKFYTKLICVF